MTNKELQEWLKQFPDETRMYNGERESYVWINITLQQELKRYPPELEMNRIFIKHNPNWNE